MSYKSPKLVSEQLLKGEALNDAQADAKKNTPCRDEVTEGGAWHSGLSLSLFCPGCSSCLSSTKCKLSQAQRTSTTWQGLWVKPWCCPSLTLPFIFQVFALSSSPSAELCALDS